ncbi:LytR/AlgR family response regulator transcription factor [Lachnospira multipara]|uniref:LytR/AlgR family response regulator transcription factor n=1 Tax=Lachnospira multipara TaxID=28051 RepID=UPI000410A34D|nr:response regulator transcription factor [Lachnospira multipara]
MDREKLYIGICDDEDYFIQQIKFAIDSYLEEKYDNYECLLMHSGEELLEYKGETIDLLFLDIQLSGMNGIEIMNKVLHSNKVWRIVFVSSHEEEVWNSFSMKTLGFCRKPIVEEEIAKYIKIVLSELRKDFLIKFKENDDSTYVKLSELYYIEAEGSYIKLFTAKGSFIISGKIGDWEKKLLDYHICRIHKSYMVNLMYVKVEGNVVIVSPINEKLTIGRLYKKKFKESYEDFILESMRLRHDI